MTLDILADLVEARARFKADYSREPDAFELGPEEYQEWKRARPTFTMQLGGTDDVRLFGVNLRYVDRPGVRLIMEREVERVER